MAHLVVACIEALFGPEKGCQGPVADTEKIEGAPFPQFFDDRRSKFDDRYFAVGACKNTSEARGTL